jgi:predicted site-specific integrase-resolvase
MSVKIKLKKFLDFSILVFFVYLIYRWFFLNNTLDIFSHNSNSVYTVGSNFSSADSVRCTYYLKRYFSSHGANITIINQIEAKGVQNELVQNLIAIITSFSGRVHGMRSRGKRKSRKPAKKQ